LKPGQDVKIQIITVDPIERKIGLSIKGATRQTELADVQGYAPGSTGGATLGDVMRAKLQGEGDKQAKKKTSKAAKKPRGEEDWGDE
jgi:small subunit ribosomal protein S1